MPKGRKEEEKMNATMKVHLETIKFGENQVHNHVTVIPLFSQNGAGPDYLTLKEAMEAQLIAITEVTEGGSVPELKVKNTGARPVLILDGEELSGAKQNRVLNTTILVKECSETVIPVSCTEEGRWSYRSAHFQESGHMMSARLRRVKNESVAYFLKSSRRYASDQLAVWEGIRDQSEAADVQSPTGAMRDIHEAKKEDLDAYLEHFTLIPGQSGILVLVGGKVAGMDMLSRSEAFRVIYPKLIKSYVMDAILEKRGKSRANPLETAQAFLADILQCREQKYESVGHGTDYRYEGGKVVGSALIHEGTVIHMAFFRVTQADKAGSMAGFSRRRGFRR